MLADIQSTEIGVTCIGNANLRRGFGHSDVDSSMLELRWDNAGSSESDEGCRCREEAMRRSGAGERGNLGVRKVLLRTQVARVPAGVRWSFLPHP